jgi:hypothetical protein
LKESWLRLANFRTSFPSPTKIIDTFAADLSTTIDGSSQQPRVSMGNAIPLFLNQGLKAYKKIDPMCLNILKLFVIGKQSTS